MSHPSEDVLARLRAAIGPLLEQEGFAPARAADALVWEKPGDLAEAGEVDRVTFAVDPEAALVTGRAESWMGPSENVRALDLAHREAAHDGPPPLGWPVGDEAGIEAALTEIAGLVTGQLIGWLDEPVPLARPRLGVGGLGLDLGGFALPGDDAT